MLSRPLLLLFTVAVVTTVVDLPPAQAAKELVFAAPPRGMGDNETDVYQPVADYLSAKIGKKIVFRHAGNWLTYQDEMRAGKYDLVFDGPHFVSWRMAKLEHEPLVKLPGKFSFVVMVKKDNDKISNIKHLVGRTVCGLAPPNLATLTLYAQFDNPVRQPHVIEVTSFEDGYKGVASGKCVGTVLRDGMFKRLNEKEDAGKAIFQSDGIANQAFSAGPRFSEADKVKIAEALLAPEAKITLAKFFERYNKDKDLVPAKRGEYEKHAQLLKDVWGFDLAAGELSKKN